jgi:hypothetical protein
MILQIIMINQNKKIVIVGLIRELPQRKIASNMNYHHSRIAINDSIFKSNRKGIDINHDL